MAGTSNSITTHNVLSGVLNADNVISGLVNTAFNPAYALVTQAGAQIVLFINNNDYKMYAQLKDKNGNLIYTSNIIDLPLETMVVNGRYDSNTKKLILVLDNGNEIEVPLEALINGLVNEDDLIANYYDKDEIDALLDGYWTKIELTQEDIDNWNAANAAFQSELFDDGVIKIEDSTEANINNTMNKSQLKIDLKGNTSQESTTGKNLVPNTLASGSSSGITYTVNSDGSIKLSGTATARVEPYLYKDNNNPITFKAGTYRNTSSKIMILYADGYILAPPNQTFSLDEDKNVINIYFRIENGEIVNETYYPQIILNSIADTSYEPYTGGNPAPNPDYPYPVNVVTGDNTINVESKNLLDEKGLLNATFTTGVYKFTNANFKGNRTLYFKAQLKSGKTALSGLYVALASYGFNPNSGTSTFSIRNGAIQNSGISNDFTGIDNLYISYYPTSYTWEEIINTYDLWISTSNTTYSEYQGSQTYPINLGSMELCKIGDYQDVIKRGSGKNLAKPTFDTKLSVAGSGDTRTCQTSTNNCAEIIEVQSNTKYTISGDFSILKNGTMRIAMFDNLPTNASTSTKVVTSATTFTITTDTNTKYLLLWNGNDTDTTISNLQVEKGNISTPVYEPYGKVWYKYGAIGKETLSDVSSLSTATLFGETFQLGQYSLTNAISSSRNYNFYCNKVYPANEQYGKYAGYRNTTKFFVITDTSDTVQNFNSNISGSILYYILATPTTTEITDTTLIEQLDNLEKAYSYDTQTNISQTNHDKPFILDINAIADNVNGLKLENENQEYKTNKVIELSSNSTDDEYPSAKCVYDIVGNIEAVLAAMDSGSGV